MDTTDMTFKEPGKDLLRFLTCGSVDDGKSTLIGRLLHDSKLVFEDQLMALARDSARHGTTGDDIDFALLVDGLEAEREQGITIDVAYRFFTTPRRSFIVADTPGHEQYTRNMATGASRAELAIILIDARKGISVQTRRHSLICSLLGIRHVVVAINKVDLIAYDEERFGAIASEYCALASELGFSSVFPIPISARYGDNVATISAETGWYKGPSLLEYLETVNVEGTETGDAFRLPVQLVVRPNLDFRGYAGTVIAGKVSPGDSIMVGKSGKSSIVKEVLTYDGPQLLAKVGDAVTITLVDDIDVGRGDLLCSLVSPPEISDQFAAEILWMSEKALMPGRSYLARIGTNMTPITVTAIKHKVDVNTRDHLAAVTLELNEIGLCNLATGAEIAFDRYAENRKTGSFILIDRFTNNTVGAGMIAFPLRRGANTRWQPLLVGKLDRAAIKQQRAAIVWFTGLSGAGKSAIANIIEQRLHAAGHHTMLLDGDNIRHGLNRDLGFAEADRVENIRRVGEIAKLMVEGGLIVLCSFISPYRAERETIRSLVADDEFIEVFVDTPIEECIRRDPKGLYAKAKAGTIKNFTGFDAPYEAPDKPEIHLSTVGLDPQRLAEDVIKGLVERKIARL